MLFVAGAGFFLFLLANEITPILVARRMRYTMVLDGAILLRHMYRFDAHSRLEVALLPAACPLDRFIHSLFRLTRSCRLYESTINQRRAYLSLPRLRLRVRRFAGPQRADLELPSKCDRGDTVGHYGTTDERLLNGRMWYMFPTTIKDNWS